MEAPKSKRSYVMKIVSADLEQIRNVAIGAAGNLVFISNKKSNPEKFISIFQHYNYWFKNFETGEYRDSLQVQFPDLNWCDGYQKLLLDFATEPNQQDLLSVSAKCTRDEYLGEILWRKFSLCKQDCEMTITLTGTLLFGVVCMVSLKKKLTTLQC